jgi:replicative DNA helicase
MESKKSFLERVMPRDIDLDPEYSSLTTYGQVKTFREIANEKKNNQNFKIVDYGIPGLDRLTDGIYEGELISISGLTKQGKTTLAQSITRNVIKKDHTVGCFTFEVTPARFLEKFKGDEKALDFGLLPVEHKAGDLRWLFERIAEMHVSWHARIFVIDHLHYLFDMWGSRNISITIGQVVRALKHLAVKGGFTIFLLCHYSKGQKEENQDSYENIRDSSLIAQESDAVFLIRRMQEGGEYNESALLTIEFHRRTGVMKKKVGLIKVGNWLVERELPKEDNGRKRNYGYGD